MPPKTPDYILEADRVWGPWRFRMASRLWFKKTPFAANLRSTGEPVTVLSWRFAWYGLALCLQFSDGRVEHGYDPATVKFTPRLFFSAWVDQDHVDVTGAIVAVVRRPDGIVYHQTEDALSYEEAEQAAEAWLTAHYPQWQNPDAYWNGMP